MDYNELQLRSDGFHYTKNSDKPYNGWVSHGGLNLSSLMQFKDGKIHGTSAAFHGDGQIASLYQSKNGKTIGVSQEWWPDGSKKIVGEFNKGKTIKLEDWNENGEKVKQLSENGGETFKILYRNGEMESEMIYKSRLLRVLTIWNRDGSLKVQSQYDSSGNFIPKKDE